MTNPQLKIYRDRNHMFIPTQTIRYEHANESIHQGILLGHNTPPIEDILTIHLITIWMSWEFTLIKILDN